MKAQSNTEMAAADASQATPSIITRITASVARGPVRYGWLLVFSVTYQALAAASSAVAVWRPYPLHGEHPAEPSRRSRRHRLARPAARHRRRSRRPDGRTRTR